MSISRRSIFSVAFVTLLLGEIPPGSTPARAARTIVTFDDSLASVAASVPGFAGLFVNESTNQVFLLLTSPSQQAASAARGKLADVLGDPSLLGRDVVALKARFSFTQLRSWYSAISDKILAISGAVSTDIDEKTNTLHFRFSDVDAARPKVSAYAAGAGVPLDALVLEQAQPIHMAVSSVQDFRRPVVGGTQIEWSDLNGNSFFCTLGFVAVKGGVAGFITNSHCSAVRGRSNDGTAYYQNDFSLITNKIGVEGSDPPYTVTPCPAGRVCRYSDTSFIVADLGVLSTQGGIAHPSSGITWNGLDTYRVVWEASQAVGTSVRKVGRTSGISTGTISVTCEDVNVDNSNITLKCQSEAGYLSQPGDSGSPVFKVVNSPSVNDVWNAGINWGYNPVTFTGVFSTIGDIQMSSEMGLIDTCDQSINLC